MCEHLRALGDAELLRLRQRYFAIAPGALAFGCAASQRPGCETCHLTLGDDAMVCLQCGATRHFLSSSCCVRLSVRNARSLQDIAGAGDARTSKRPRIRRDGTCFCTCWKAITGSPHTAWYAARPLARAFYVSHSRPRCPPRARRPAQRGELYCNKCSDFVYDESFNRIRHVSFKRPASLDERCGVVPVVHSAVPAKAMLLSCARSAWRGDFFCSPAVAANRKRRHLTNQSAAGRGLPPAALNEWISRCGMRTPRPGPGAHSV